MVGSSTDKTDRWRRIRVLLCISEIDGHDRGLKYIAKKLQEDGMEVIYTTFQTAEEIAKVAIQESADVIGLSSSTGGHTTYISDLTSFLRKQGEGEILIIAGGIIPTVDIPGLKEMGVERVFGPGTHGYEVVNYIRGKLDERNRGVDRR